jgi:hypothetical protein
MTVRSIVRLVLVGSGWLMPVLCVAQSARVVDGYRYTMTGTQTAGGIPGRVDRTDSMEVRGLVAGGVVRTEYTKGATPFSRPGVYTLLDTRTNEIVLVDSVALKSVAINAAGMLAIRGSEAPQMTVSDTALKLEDLGAGDVVLGYATRKLRLTIRYTIAVGDLEEAKSTATQVTTLNISDAITAMDQGFAMATQSPPTPVGQATPGNALERFLQEVYRKLPKGFSLVTEQDMRISSPMGELASASRMRVTELTPVKLPAAAFSLPMGLQKVDYLSYMMSVMQAPP